MTDFMADLARATLPVALVLLILASAARAATWARVDDPRARDLARQCGEPLATWCLVAIGAHALAVGAAGDAGALSLALPLIVAVAAVLLRSAGEAEAAPVRVSPQPPAPSAKPAAEPRPAPTGSLWAGRQDEETRREGALWSR